MNGSGCGASARSLLGAIALLAMGAGVAAGDERLVAASVTPPASEATPAASPKAPRAMKIDDYQIGAHDLLDISVFQVPDLSRTVRVNSRGLISLPLIGSVQAAGLTSDQLETTIARKLSENYLQDPQVSVFIKEYISQRVTIEGSVQKAGVYQLTGPTTLLQAIAMASGVDQLADENAVTVFRDNGSDARQSLVYDLEAIRAGKKPDPEIKGDDIVVVQKSGSRSAIKTVTDTIRGIVGFGRY